MFGRDNSISSSRKRSGMEREMEDLSNHFNSIFWPKDAFTSGVDENANASDSYCFTYFTHRDKTRVQMPAKVFPHLKLLCWLFMSPHSWF
jgi:hypothetical protein